MENNTVIKAYKGFDENLQCRGFQYEIGKEYEINGKIVCCSNGFHACPFPLEVLDYYFFIDCTSDRRARFCEVEQSGNFDFQTTPRGTKVASSKIKIIRELTLHELIEAGIEWLKVKSESDKTILIDERNLCGTKLSSCEVDKKIASINQTLCTICSNGDYNTICSNSLTTNVTSGGDAALIALTHGGRINSSGTGTKICSLGSYPVINSSGSSTKIISEGHHALINSSGLHSLIYSSGDYSEIHASAYTKINSTGEHCVINCSGNFSMVKAGKGSRIISTGMDYKKSSTGMDYRKSTPVPYTVCKYVDGEHIKADTWYSLWFGEFEELHKD